ncbi:hypothetical protein I79_005814 [Cricetulus griseus]|uniref:Uncharacterized protein n=1 Tax=Cricetulus griseus TaxID=10029 RepID=G3H663_CRIGR|nr:hypothetical protein I79_005814 [Cricetulus griseus]
MSMPGLGVQGRQGMGSLNTVLLRHYSGAQKGPLLSKCPASPGSLSPRSPRLTQEPVLSSTVAAHSWGLS